MLSPQALSERGVPVYEVLQEAGDFIVTFPFAFCAAVDTGWPPRSCAPIEFAHGLVLPPACAKLIHLKFVSAGAASPLRRLQLRGERELRTSGLAAVRGRLL